MKKTHFITQSAIIAAIYVVLTSLLSSINLASGFIQCRISEALCIVPIFTSAGIPGLTIGCFLSNIINGFISGSGFNVIDIVFGTIATASGALLTYLFRNKRLLAIASPIITNTLIIPFVLKFSYHLENAFILIVISIFLGELLSVGVFGTLLLKILDKYKDQLFK